MPSLSLQDGGQMAEIILHPTLTSNGSEVTRRFQKLAIEQLDETILEILAIGAQFEPHLVERMLAQCKIARQAIVDVEPTDFSSAKHIDAFKKFETVARRLIPLTQVCLYVVGAGCGIERSACEDCLA
jgi:hypothetical protein